MCVCARARVCVRLCVLRGALRVYSDWTRQRHDDGVKHDTTHVSQSEHSDRPRHSAATASCVGIRSIIDALLNRDKEMSQSEVVAFFLMPTIITE